MNYPALHQTLSAIEASTGYSALIGFYGLYPIITSFIYIVTAILYYTRRKKSVEPLQITDEELPFVSVIIPAYCEEDVIEKSIEGVLDLDYPNFELIVVNDG